MYMGFSHSNFYWAAQNGRQSTRIYCGMACAVRLRVGVYDFCRSRNKQLLLNGLLYVQAAVALSGLKQQLVQRPVLLHVEPRSENLHFCFSDFSVAVARNGGRDCEGLNGQHSTLLFLVPKIHCGQKDSIFKTLRGRREGSGQIYFQIVHCRSIL